MPFIGRSARAPSLWLGGSVVYWTVVLPGTCEFEICGEGAVEAPAASAGLSYYGSVLRAGIPGRTAPHRCRPLATGCKSEEQVRKEMSHDWAVMQVSVLLTNLKLTGACDFFCHVSLLAAEDLL